MRDLDGFLQPNSVAVVGASSNPMKFGYEITKNVVETAAAKADVYPISLKAEEILGLKAYKNASELPKIVDLCVVAVPAPYVLAVVKDFFAAGTSRFIVVSGGFKEAGPEGIALEEELNEFVKANKIGVVGPNCVGVINTHHGMNLSFIQTPLVGPIGLVSQSGATGAHINYFLRHGGMGMSRFVNLGNSLDLTVADAIKGLAVDNDTKVVGVYLEGVEDGVALYEALKFASQRKPVVLLKGGMTDLGAASAASHTGSLASSKTAIQAACRQSGTYLAENDREFISVLQALGYLEPPTSEKVIQLTNAGGPSVMAADLLSPYGIEYPEWPEETKEKMREFLPPFVNLVNPLDMLASARKEAYQQATDLMIQAYPDALLVALCVVPTFLGMKATDHLEGTMQAIKDRGAKATILGFMSGEMFQACRGPATEAGLPLFETVEEVAYAARALLHRRKIINKWAKRGN